MQTILKYLTEEKFEDTAEIIGTGTDGRGEFIVLDQTIFYPQAGGQPSDQGYVTLGSNSFRVNFVKLEEGKAKHYVELGFSTMDEGKKVELFVDQKLRLQHSKIHTAGHLMDNVIAEMGDIDLKGIKGFHFVEGSYVEFIGTKPADVPHFIERLNRELEKAINKNYEIIDKLVSFEELSSLGIFMPPNLPKDKPLRMVQIGKLEPIPCGGTHLKKTGELEKIIVSKVKAKKDRIKISYKTY